MNISFNRLHNVRPQSDSDGVSDSVCGIYASTFKATEQMTFHNNEVFDIASSSGNGGAGWYGDGGSTAWTITSNLIHDTSYFPLERNSNWQGGAGGAPSRISNNIFVANTGMDTAADVVPKAWVGRNDGVGKGAVEWEMWTKNETFERNIVVSLHGGDLVFTGHACNSTWNPGAELGPDCSNRYADNFRASMIDRNVYWVAAGLCNASAVAPRFPDARNSDNGRMPAAPSEGVTFEAWQALHDQHSVVADPLFVDVQAGDYRLRPGSPALKLGFEPIDLGFVGPSWSCPR